MQAVNLNVDRVTIVTFASLNSYCDEEICYAGSGAMGISTSPSSPVALTKDLSVKDVFDLLVFIRATCC